MFVIIGGTSLLGTEIFSGWPDKIIETQFGAVTVKIGDTAFFIQRHGNPCLPPHRLNHRANIAAVKELGAVKIVAINSVGSLKESLKPGTLVIPDDFASPWRIETFYDDTMHFTIPALDTIFAREIFTVCRSHTPSVAMGGTYIQTIGPRLETRAEVRMLKQFGDVVGMTLASEATLAIEYALPYASICSIDNYCHGIMPVPLTMEEISRNALKNITIIEEILIALTSKGL
ncbi:MAG: MTAP family purine nucleoside phosphorylase [Syntrophorhabdaceae bacterium]